jgi:hypothetical protein
MFRSRNGENKSNVTASMRNVTSRLKPVTPQARHDLKDSLLAPSVSFLRVSLPQDRCALLRHALDQKRERLLKFLKKAIL